MKIQDFFPAKFSSLFKTQENFLEPYGVNVYKNLTAGVSSIAKKAKEVEEDARRRFCDYPSA
jgi:hypothetical protein